MEISPEKATSVPKITRNPGRAARVWAAAKSGLRHTGRMFNPKHVFGIFKQDVRNLGEAKSIKDAEIYGNSELIESKTRMKLMAAVAISEFAGTYVGAPVIGLASQYIAGSAYAGIGGTIAGDYLPAVLSFDIAWLMLNKGYYSESAETRWGKVKNFLKDVVPVHGMAAGAAVPSYIITAGICSLVIEGIRLVSSLGIANKIPMALVAQTLNATVAETLFLIFVSGVASESGVVEKLAKKYNAYLDSKYKNANTIHESKNGVNTCETRK